GDHIADLLFIQLTTQLQASHDIHRFFQLPVGAVVEVGIGQLDVAQGRYLEVEPVRVLAGDGHTTFSRVVGLVGFDHAHALEGSTASGRAVVAGHAADAL